MKLNQKTVDGLRLPAGKASAIFWDDDVAGLGLRIQGKKRTWIIRYRPVGDQRQRQVTLGPAAGMPIREARRLAGEHVTAARQGRDLAADRKAEAAATRQARQDDEKGRVSVIAERYLADAEKRFRPMSFDAEKRFLRKHWSPIHDRVAKELTVPELMRELEIMAAERGCIAANRARQCLNRLFVWAIPRGYLDANPLIGVPALAKEIPRDRVLSLEELAAVWRALVSMAPLSAF